jgi:LysR family glycine cleavage system transcriptional activator
MRKLPPLAELRAFEAAARHLSFKDAASELARTPTAISHQVRLLEQFCGLPLFRRRPRPLTLTKAGARLYPVVRDGLDAFAFTVDAIKKGSEQPPLIVSTTNAFASRWLVPRLPLWHEACPDTSLEVVGTDSVLDLHSDKCDIAIRCLETARPDLASRELLRGNYMPVCSPELLPAGKPLTQLEDLRRLTLIHWYWSPSDNHPPTWRWALDIARSMNLAVPELEEFSQLTFREELHAIEAVIAGQGIAILHDVIVAPELETGALIKAADFSGPGPVYYVDFLPDHPRKETIETFIAWIFSVR